MSDPRSEWLTGGSPPAGASGTTIDSQLALDLYRKLRLLRTFERASAAAYGRGQIHGTHRSSYGQEAVPVGVCHALRPGDLVSPGLRSVGDILARGGDPASLMAELFGRATGLCGGRAGALQLSDVSHGVIGGFAVMTANVPMAVGMAIATRAAGKGDVVVCFIGDRATNQGVFHEAMNAASLHRLALICVGVNNAPADASTSLGEHTAADSMAALAAVHGIAAEIVDGTDVVAVHEAAAGAVQRARDGAGPSFLECRCFPLGEPSRAQTQQWIDTMRRSGRFEGLLAVKKREIGRAEPTPPAEWLAGDPIDVLERRILTAGLASSAELRDIDAELAAIVDGAVERAAGSPQPLLSEGVGVFASSDGGDR
jgi:TPP-dependent pyruvate/acetoin dehydrogenase alpha subunit